MRRTVNRLLSLAAAAAFALPALAAGPADDLLGTWECYVPGGAPTKTPPIVWFGPVDASGATAGSTVDLDGFARTVYGISEVVSEAGGWWKVQPQDGDSFLVQTLPPRGNTPQLSLKRGAASYNCLRLPKYPSGA
jgi:hypothetical protein